MFYAADLFCGAGGSSTGLVKAASRRNIQLNLLAVNHWRVAVETHSRNHPWARHLCADLSTVDPNKVVPGGRLDALIASPECTHHSIARGGKPCSDQSRASAWHVLHWIERLKIEDVLIENVQEFQNWGPLLDNGRPDPDRKGETFNAFVSAIKSFGYSVEWRVLNSADYGDATSRRRLFVRASRGRIQWPEPTHAGRWKPARDIIDWKLKGSSIFNRKRPLARKTLDRIEAGLRKFGGEPFIAVLRGTNDKQSGSWSRSVNDPVPTISAGGIHSAICEPFIIPMEHSGRQPVRSMKKPLPTITTARGGSFGLCQPFIVNVAHKGSDHSRSRSIDAPLSTIPAGHRGELALCEPFLCKYYGSAKTSSVSNPLDTVTSKARFALVEPGRIDILFRMLQPHELAAAMGFDSYEFAGTKTDQVRQIGNAVAVNTAAALCGSIIDSSRAQQAQRREAKEPSHATE